MIKRGLQSWSLCLIVLLSVISHIDAFRMSQSRYKGSTRGIQHIEHGNKKLSVQKLYAKGDKEAGAQEVVDLSVLIGEASSYRQEALDLLAAAIDSKEVETFRVLFLGKNGKITGLMKQMKKLASEDKPKLGEVVNEAKGVVEKAIEDARERLENKELNDLIEREDIGNTYQITIDGDPNFLRKPGARHPLALTMDLATSIFEDIGYEAIIGSDSSPEIENDFFNFEALGFTPSHPARDMQDTFYINTEDIDKRMAPFMMRTHTSAVQIREMEKRKPPFKIVSPGRVFRKDDVDATHFPVFHQVEILSIDEIGKLTVPHLMGTIKHFLRKMFGPDVDVKFRASYFPFTEPSMEVDVFFKGKWLEVLGCGMVDPVVLESVGIDHTKYSGFAAGFGVERFAMIMHNIQDIRLFWENNMEFLEQFPTNPYSIPGDGNDAE